MVPWKYIFVLLRSLGGSTEEANLNELFPQVIEFWHLLKFSYLIHDVSFHISCLVSLHKANGSMVPNCQWLAWNLQVEPKPNHDMDNIQFLIRKLFLFFHEFIHDCNKLKCRFWDFQAKSKWKNVPNLMLWHKIRM